MTSFDLAPQDAFYVVEGEAQDGEAIIRLRPEIEDHIRESIGEFTRTELFWNLKDEDDPDNERPSGDRPFVYQIHFFRE